MQTSTVTPTSGTASPAATPTASQIRLIQNSWQSLEPAAAQVGQLFYQRLFEIDPTLRPMFGPDLAQQGHKLVAMLSTVVGGLHRLDALLPTVAGLGRRHGGYGVEPAHYETVAQSLLWTLQRGLGTQATEPVLEAWAAAYRVLASAMQAATAQPSA